MIDLPKLKTDFPFYAVGGYVRDKLINPESTPKDLDFAIVCPDLESAKDQVKKLGGGIYLSHEQFLTIRCNIPRFGAVDVAVARKDGGYSDGRRPDEVETATTIEEDLQRRDCTMNAIAVDMSTGELIDPFNGLSDIQNSRIVAVGNAEDRVGEDYLRLLRYLRFSITLNMRLAGDIFELFFNDHIINNLVESVSEERIREELMKCFKHDTVETMRHYAWFGKLFDAVFSKTNLWMKPTNEKK